MISEDQLQAAWLGLDVSPLVPDRYAEYRPVVKDALAFFLERLPEEYLLAILAEQQSLPAEASDAKRFAALLGQCPTLHKLGQVVARDRRLDPGLRRRLQTLESMEPKTPMSEVRPVIEKELGSTAAELELRTRPLAEASVAVVVPFRTAGDNGSQSASGVLKVLKPGIEERVRQELDLWSTLAAYIDERCERDGLSPLRCQEIFETVRELLSNEVRLDLEQAHLSAAKKFYEGANQVHIPALLPYSTPRLTAMERVFGKKVTDTDDLPAVARRDLAGVILEQMIARPVWSTHGWAVFHADPHAGNLMYTDEGRLAVLDWSLTAHLDKGERIQTVQVLLGALALDATRVARAIAAMATTPPNEAALRAVVEVAIAALYRDAMPGFRWLVGLLDAAMLTAGVNFSDDLLLFRKAVLTLEGVVADVSMDKSLDKVLAVSAGRQFLKEWITRSVSPPASRHFGTHVSNLDLLWLYWSLPAGAARFVSRSLSKS